MDEDMEQADAVVEFWERVKKEVDAFFVSNGALDDVRAGIQSVLESRPFAMDAEVPVSGLVSRYPESMSSQTWRFVLRHHSGIDALLKEVIIEYNVRNYMQSEQRAFHAPFRGQAHERLFRHLMGCRDQLIKAPYMFTYPYFAIAQSSGFGKSRLLRELASTIAEREFESGKLHMQVVNISAHEGHVRSAFPPATMALREHLFADHDWPKLADLLESLFEVVMMAPWAPMQKRLMKRFDGEDSNLTATLKAHQRCDTVVKDTQDRLLVLAVDQARSCLSLSPKKSGFHSSAVFQFALQQAYDRIYTRFGNNSSMMAIVVDSEIMITKSSRAQRMLDPFVLTDTMDLAVDCSVDKPTLYKQLVMEATDPTTRDESWQRLLPFGRPLWALGLPSCIPRTKEGIIRFAASKLIGGSTGTVPDTALSETNYYGVAALLCRLGLRPCATIKLASRVVADFMAVLSYTNYKHDQRLYERLDGEQIISSYSSDPVLTLGATYLWYEHLDDDAKPSVFATKMLPQLHRLLLEEAIDTSGRGCDVVARVVLLLAMDASAVVETRKERARWEAAGSFASVWSFLRTLHGDAPDAIAPCVMSQLQATWTRCLLAFTHFVQLEKEPTEACLWAMLARRAAGVFPRSNSVDLVIPVFVPAREKTHQPPGVSMILVRVAARRRYTLASTRPANCFQATNSLGRLSPSQVLRVHMKFDGGGDATRTYVRDDHDGGGCSYVLCLQNIAPWSTTIDSSVANRVAGEAHTVTVVSEEVAAALQAIARPWWKVEEFVVQDLIRCGHDEDSRQTKVEAATRHASLSLAEHLLLNGQSKGGENGAAP